MTLISFTNAVMKPKNRVVSGVSSHYLTTLEKGTPPELTTLSLLKTKNDSPSPWCMCARRQGIKKN